EPDGLADAEAGTVEELDEGAIAQVAGRRPAGCLHEPLGLGGRERPRQLPRSSRQRELGGGVVLPRPDENFVAEESTQSCDAARYRRGREAVGAKVGEITLELFAARRRRRALEPASQGS